MSDLIDRQAAIDHWRSIIDATDEGDRYNMGFDDGLEFCISDLSTMLSAEPERKTGQWLQISPAGIYECSECAQMVMTEDIGCYKYCHGCGTYMGGDTDGDMPD